MRLFKVMPAVLLTMAALLLATACTTAGGDPERPATGGPPSAPAAGNGVAAPATLGGQQSIIATTKADLAHYPVKAELYGPLRSQGFLTVRVRITNMTAADQAGSFTAQWQIGSIFAGGTRGPGGTDTFAGVYLLDRKNSKQYLVAHNANGAFLASSSLSGVFVQPQQAVELYATFGAPPDDVKAVDVVIPELPVFENVPLG